MLSGEQPNGRMPSLRAMTDAVRGIASPGDVIFLATDNCEAVAAFRESFGSRLYFRDIHRTQTMNTKLHHASPQTVEEAKDCVVDALLLARCNHFVHVVCNIATAVLYFNPTLAHTFVTADVGPV